MYLAKGLYRSCEIDDYQNGCISCTGYSIQWDVEFESDSLGGLLKKLKDFHNITNTDLIIEDNRIYIVSHEEYRDGHWLYPDEKDMDLWRQGKKELYLVDYSYKLYNSI